MKRCPFCGLPMEEDEEYCHECGAPADWSFNDDEEVVASDYVDDEELWQEYPEEEEDVEEEDIEDIEEEDIEDIEEEDEEY